MFRRLFCVLACVPAALVGASACGQTTYIGGECGEQQDCREDWNYGGGTDCIDGWCKCPDPAHAEQPCCPDGGYKCEQRDFTCRPKAVCEPAAADAGADAPPDVSPPAAEVSECDEATAADDCPKILGLMPDPECARFTCIKHRCDIENLVLGPLPHDVPGDCRRTECGVMGDRTEVPWLEDGPIDTNPCTWGTCSATGEPEQIELQDGVFCPDTDFGVCRAGVCIDCDESMNVFCGKPLSCDIEWCVPAHCTNLATDVDESDANCGGLDCKPCFPGQNCVTGSDCESDVCSNMKCQASTHVDGTKNDGETGVDCGCDEGGCEPCPDGQGCALPNDCKSNVCFFGVCRPASCFNGALDAGEDAVDCGGLSCSPC